MTNETKPPAIPSAPATPAASVNQSGTPSESKPTPSDPPKGAAKVAPAAPPSAQKPPPLPPGSPQAAPRFSIPKSPSPMRTGFQQQIVLIYGRPKSGKSTFASQFPRAVFIPTEPGLKHLSVRKIPEDQEAVASFAEFDAAVAAIQHHDPKAEDVKTIVIDTIDSLVALAEQEICEQRRVKHVSEIPEKAGYTLVNARVERAIRNITKHQQGVVLMSHISEEEIVTAKGVISKASSSLRAKTRQFIHGLCDMILFVDVSEEIDPKTGNIESKPILRTKPNIRWDAGERNGYLPDSIPMVWSVFKQAYDDGVARKLREVEAAKAES